MRDELIMPSGKVLSLSSITADDVYIPDIVAMLSNIRRFNGRGWSVMDHTLAMYASCKCWACDDLNKLVLLHDTTEAYIGDIIQPVKSAVPAVRELEDNVYRCILSAMGITELPDDKRLKLFDMVALAVEYEELFGKPYTEAGEAWGFEEAGVDRTLVWNFNVQWAIMRKKYDTESARRAYFTQLLSQIQRENINV